MNSRKEIKNSFDKKRQTKDRDQNNLSNCVLGNLSFGGFVRVIGRIKNTRINSTG
jgi:hypothetical protein